MKVVNQSELAACVEFLTTRVTDKEQLPFCSSSPVDSSPADLGNRADGVPALRQDLRVGVIEEADEA